VKARTMLLAAGPKPGHEAENSNELLLQSAANTEQRVTALVATMASNATKSLQLAEPVNPLCFESHPHRH
jgi:hypothetical protein